MAERPGDRSQAESGPGSGPPHDPSVLCGDHTGHYASGPDRGFTTAATEGGRDTPLLRVPAPMARRTAGPEVSLRT
jgi:hypothetical protein